MYAAACPMPLIALRCAVPSLLYMNCQLLGECAPGGFITLPVSGDGDCYITAQPLVPGFLPITRKISFEAGALLPPPSDLTVYVWPGGVYETALDCPAVPNMLSGMRQLDVLNDGYTRLTLYSDCDLRLCCERPDASFTLPLGGGGSGALSLLEYGGQRCYCAHLYQDTERLLLLEPGDLSELLDISGDAVLTDPLPAAIDSLGTVCGHQRRTVYPPADGFAPAPSEVGYFTLARCAPATHTETAIAFCEAVLHGLEDEALSLLAPDPRAALTFGDIAEFLGEFTAVRPPLSGACAGLVSGEPPLLFVRLLEPEFDGLLISDLLFPDE